MVLKGQTEMGTNSYERGVHSQQECGTPWQSPWPAVGGEPVRRRGFARERLGSLIQAERSGHHQERRGQLSSVGTVTIAARPSTNHHYADDHSLTELVQVALELIVCSKRRKK